MALGNPIYTPQHQITLQPIQIQSGVYCAQMRQDASANSRQARGYNAKSAEQSLNMHISGAAAEIAFAVGFRQPYAYSVNQFGQADFVTKKATAVDVKRATHKGCYVIAANHVHSDWVYVWMHSADDKNFECCGYIKGSDLLPGWICNPGNRIDSRTGQPAVCYKVPPSALKPLSPKN